MSQIWKYCNTEENNCSELQQIQEPKASGSNIFPPGGSGNPNMRPSQSNDGNGNSNKNYVNFNQFMMQHNMIGNGGNGVSDRDGVTDSNGTFSTNLCNMQPGPSATNGGRHYNFGDHNPWSLGEEYNHSQDLPSSYNLFRDNNDKSTYNLFSNEQNNYTDITKNTPFYNFYTPFGNNGTSSYIFNPFTADFNYGATPLHPNAPEFIPAFKDLSITEVKVNGNDKRITSELISKEGSPKDKNLDQATGTVALSNTENKPSDVQDQFNSSTSQSWGNVKRPFESQIISNSSGNGSAKTIEFINSDICEPTTSGISDIRNHEMNGEQPENSQKTEKPFGLTMSFAKAERERERDNRRFNNGRRINFDNFAERPARFDRDNRFQRGDRNERFERSDRSDRGVQRGNRDRDRDYYQRFDNHRSNKRRDDWNRNRDRVNGFHVEEKFSIDNGKDSPLPSPEKKISPRRSYPENEKLSQRDKLIRDIETRRLECLVCVEAIKAHQAVWSCQNCYHILHLQCIIKWASSSKSVDGWRCPACQNVDKQVPRDYYCFCGKLKNPTYNRQDTAHSCGDVCNRKENCSHACTLLCHPGPCPPCQASVKRECGCGKTTKIMQCCLKESIECDSVCDKVLNCGVHNCTTKCHDDKCGPCVGKVEQTCYCLKQDRQVACTRESHDKAAYSCGKNCGKELLCGNHTCKDCCHPGECRPCKQSPEVVTTCPCGKMPVASDQRKLCTDPIPLCQEICNKTLRCGKPAHPHHCISKCHLSVCPPCNKQTAVKCRCGHMDQMIKCRQLATRADDARCKKRCVKKRSCGKHKCNQECCIDIDHICPLPCNYTLSCGKHKCDQPCHRGNCPPCYRSSFEELFCECGTEVIYPPVACGTKRPTCTQPCSRPHPCTHTPQHNCHSSASCPPCMILTTKWCYGNHEQRKTIPCSQLSFSCGLPCNKPLPCGRHKCIRACHESACQQVGNMICKQSCTKVRTSCGHKCMAPCHDDGCPDTPCKEMVEVQCECGNRKQMRACPDLSREYSRIATAQLASSMAEMQRGNYMELSEILAPVKLNKTNKTLDCNEECRMLERNRRLAIGLQVRNPDMQQKLLTKYSDYIRNFAKRDPTLVKSIYDSLTNLVKLAKESKQKSRSHSFPVMNRDKRQLVHELCEMFGVDSVAYDAEPNRNVVATAHRDRSWLPATSIIDVIQRESGQRRVPVPSNNAWSLKK